MRVCLFMEVNTICLSRMRMWSSIQKKETQSHVCLISVIYVENIMKIPTILLNIRKCSMENQKICLVRSVVKYLSIGAG